jgi:mRNA-degrading endonuclease RelE of RelBE toxin-antitoxin system
MAPKNAQPKNSLMNYNLFTTRRFERSVKQLPPTIQTHLKNEIFKLATSPTAGKRLKDKLSRFRSLHTIQTGTHYRMLYKINEKEKTIDLLYAGTRENFYQEAARANLNTA